MTKILRVALGTLLAALLLAGAVSPVFAQAQAIADLDAALAGASVPIDITTATTTQLIAAPSGLNPAGGQQAIAITAFDVVAAGSGSIELVYGTGTNCGTGQGNLTGNYALTAQARAGGGAGFGPVLSVPAGNAVCAVTSAAVGMHGFIAYRVK